MKKLLIGLLAIASLSAAAETAQLTGAGATFPFPIYSKWFSVYRAQKGVEINYQSIGSGGGIKQITAKTVDFGASDAPLSESEMKDAGNALQHIPTVMGAVVLVYNVPELKSLRLSPSVLADMYEGKITQWNDQRIAADNKGAKLPETAITIAHRSDGSGTTYTFSDYLSKVSASWKAGPGTGKALKWPVGLGGKGNEGVTGLVKSTPGAIGYVELAYALNNKLEMAELKNHDGHWVKPSIETTSAAAAKAVIPDDYRVSITDQPGAQAWPISTFTYILVYKDQAGPKGKAVLDFLWWAEHDGQKMAAELDYAPLPAAVVKKVEATLKSLKVDGKTVLASNR